MAERRMFSKRIIASARFLRMPGSTQALYFHLGMAADDDGIVEAYPIMQMVNASEDDLRLLAAKGFVKVLNEDLVTYILDWQENNKIRADRKVNSIYKDLLLQVMPETPLLEPRQRADRVRPDIAEDDHGTADGQPVDDQMSTTGQPRDTNGTSLGRPTDNHGTQMGRHRIGKDRIGKVSIDTLCHVSHDDVDKSHFEIIEYLNLKTGSKFKPTTKPYVQAIRSRLKEGYTVDDFKTVIDKKCREWKGTKLEKYLTPKTLFAPSHFDTYLNSNEMAAMTDTEKKVAELNALIDAVERGTDETGNVESYGPTIDI